MILSDKTIRQYLKEKKLKVMPIEDYQIQPASIDLILDKNFLKVKEEKVKRSILLLLLNTKVLKKKK